VKARGGCLQLALSDALIAELGGGHEALGFQEPYL